MIWLLWDCRRINIVDMFFEILQYVCEWAIGYGCVHPLAVLEPIRHWFRSNYVGPDLFMYWFRSKQSMIRGIGELLIWSLGYCNTFVSWQFNTVLCILWLYWNHFAIGSGPTILDRTYLCIGSSLSICMVGIYDVQNTYVFFITVRLIMCTGTNWSLVPV